MIDEGLTYPEVGATAMALPPGYHYLQRRDVIGHGPAAFERVSLALATWQVHHRAGVRLAAPTSPAAPGLDVDLFLGFPPIALAIACRVVYVVDEPTCRGFAYGTRAGHPECGEERFLVDLGDDGAVTFEIVAFAKPGRWFTRAVGPVGRLAQRVAAFAYTRSARSFALDRAG